jgi:hypothetical protein
MKINEILAEAQTKASCGCSADSCSHCAGKHTLDEVGQKCSCCGNMIKEVKVNETATSGGTSAGGIAGTASGFASGGIGTISRAGTVNKKRKKKKEN